MELLEIGDGTVDVRLTAPECGLLAEGCEVLAAAISCQGRTGDAERLGRLGDGLGDAERTIYLVARLPWVGAVRVLDGRGVADLVARVAAEATDGHQ